MLRLFPFVRIRYLFSLSLSILLLFADVARATPLQQESAGLNLVILEGEGAINNVRQRTAREPIVQVEDKNRRPVAGASVLFMLPDSGPSGVFPNGSRVLQVTTDSQGRAVAGGLRTNNISGDFQIRVEASYQGQTASTVINQTNAVLAVAGGGISAKVIAILAIIGGAAATGALIATRGGNGNGSPSSPSTTITPGVPSVEGP